MDTKLSPIKPMMSIIKTKLKQKITTNLKILSQIKKNSIFLFYYRSHFVFMCWIFLARNILFVFSVICRLLQVNQHKMLNRDSVEINKPLKGLLIK